MIQRQFLLFGYGPGKLGDSRTPRRVLCVMLHTGKTDKNNIIKTYKFNNNNNLNQLIILIPAFNILIIFHPQ